MFKDYLKAWSNYRNDRNVMSLRTLTTLKAEIQQDLIGAFEMGESVIENNPELYDTSTSFVDFLFRLLDVTPPKQSYERKIPSHSMEEVEETPQSERDKLDRLQGRLDVLIERVDNVTRESETFHTHEQTVLKESLGQLGNIVFEFNTHFKQLEDLTKEYKNRLQQIQQPEHSAIVPNTSGVEALPFSSSAVILASSSTPAENEVTEYDVQMKETEENLKIQLRECENLKSVTEEENQQCNDQIETQKLEIQKLTEELHETKRNIEEMEQQFQTEEFEKWKRKIENLEREKRNCEDQIQIQNRTIQELTVAKEKLESEKLIHDQHTHLQTEEIKKCVDENNELKAEQEAMNSKLVYLSDFLRTTLLGKSAEKITSKTSIEKIEIIVKKWETIHNSLNEKIGQLEEVVNTSADTISRLEGEKQFLNEQLDNRGQQLQECNTIQQQKYNEFQETSNRLENELRQKTTQVKQLLEEKSGLQTNLLSQENAVRSLQQELENVRENHDLQKKQYEIEMHAGTAAEYRDNMEILNGKLMEEKNAVQNENVELKSKLGSLEKEMEGIQSQLHAKQEDFDKRFRDLNQINEYRGGIIETIKNHIQEQYLLLDKKPFEEDDQTSMQTNKNPNWLDQWMHIHALHRVYALGLFHILAKYFPQAELRHKVISQEDADWNNQQYVNLIESHVDSIGKIGEKYKMSITNFAQIKKFAEFLDRELEFLDSKNKLFEKFGSNDLTRTDIETELEKINNRDRDVKVKASTRSSSPRRSRSPVPLSDDSDASSEDDQTSRRPKKSYRKRYEWIESAYKSILEMYDERGHWVECINKISTDNVEDIVNYQSFIEEKIAKRDSKQKRYLKSISEFLQHLIPIFKNFHKCTDILKRFDTLPLHVDIKTEIEDVPETSTANPLNMQQVESNVSNIFEEHKEMLTFLNLFKEFPDKTLEDSLSELENFKRNIINPHNIFDLRYVNLYVKILESYINYHRLLSEIQKQLREIDDVYGLGVIYDEKEQQLTLSKKVIHTIGILRGESEQLRGETKTLHNKIKLNDKNLLKFVEDLKKIVDEELETPQPIDAKNPLSHEQYIVEKVRETFKTLKFLKQEIVALKTAYSNRNDEVNVFEDVTIANVIDKLHSEYQRSIHHNLQLHAAYESTLREIEETFQQLVQNNSALTKIFQDYRNSVQIYIMDHLSYQKELPAVSDEPVKCPICLELIQIGTVPHRFKCHPTHISHTGCLEAFLQNSEILACPLCREPLFPDMQYIIPKKMEEVEQKVKRSLEHDDQEFEYILVEKDLEIKHLKQKLERLIKSQETGAVESTTNLEALGEDTSKEKTPKVPIERKWLNVIQTLMINYFNLYVEQFKERNNEQLSEAILNNLNVFKSHLPNLETDEQRYCNILLEFFEKHAQILGGRPINWIPQTEFRSDRSLVRYLIGSLNQYYRDEYVPRTTQT